MASRIDPTIPDAPESFPSTIALVDALRSRRISAVEALEQAIGRIEAGDGELNAVVVRDFERARAAAISADAALAAGDRRPLPLGSCAHAWRLRRRRGGGALLSHSRSSPSGSSAATEPRPDSLESASSP